MDCSNRRELWGNWGKLQEQALELASSIIIIIPV